MKPPPKLDPDEVVVRIPLERWSRFSKDTKDTVKMYATRNPSIEEGCICVHMAHYRVDELELIFDEST